MVLVMLTYLFTAWMEITIETTSSYVHLLKECIGAIAMLFTLIYAFRKWRKG